MDLQEDKKDDLLCNVTAKWIDAFVTCASEHSFMIEAWLEDDEDEAKQVAVARTIPFLLSNEDSDFWFHLSDAFDILKVSFQQKIPLKHILAQHRRAYLPLNNCVLW